MKSTMGACAVVALLLATAVSGCFREHRDTVQKAEVASLLFKGNCGGATVQLRDEDGNARTEPFGAIAGTRYSVPTGTMILTIRRNGKDIVKRKLFLVAGQTKEIAVP